MSTFFYFRGQLVESIEGMLSESEALLRIAVLSFELGCSLKDITWSIGADLACTLD
jgi:hypothetical protein